MMSPAESEYRERLMQWSRADLLRVCRAAGLSAHRLQTNAELVHLLWVKVASKRAETR